MPYDKVPNHPKCPADRPLAVVKEADGKLMGCHVNEEAANKQIAALHASEDGREKPPEETGHTEELHMGKKNIIYTRALPDTAEVRAEDLLKDPSLPVPFIASTEGMKADGMNLKMQDWDLRSYGRYGPILWVHDYMHPPLGRGQAHIDDKLRINVHFDTDDPFAMLIRGKAIKGMMGGSVGWETDKNKKNILREFSMVPVGLDPDALPEIKRTGLRAMQSEIMGLLDEDTNESMEAYVSILRQEVMEQIKALLEEVVNLDEETSIEEEEESQEEIPEERQEENPDEDEHREDIPAHSTDEKADEDKEAEVDLMRAGAMLSKKNRDDLRKALELIQGVLERATPDEFVQEFAPMRMEDPDEGITIEILEPEEVEDSGEQQGQEETQEEPELSPGVLAQIMAVLN